MRDNDDSTTSERPIALSAPSGSGNWIAWPEEDAPCELLLKDGRFLIFAFFSDGYWWEDHDDSSAWIHYSDVKAWRPLANQLLGQSHEIAEQSPNNEQQGHLQPTKDKI